MAKESTTGKKPATSDPQIAASNTTINTTTPTPTANHASGKSRKGPQSTIGGTAVQGAKSTHPKQYTQNASQQQQQLESYNREMRRRMERLNSGEDDHGQSSVQKRRQKREERLKERRASELARVKHALPGGKVDTSIRKVYILLAVILVVIILLIVAYIFIRGF
jgi:hypothetical protein